MLITMRLVGCLSAFIHFNLYFEQNSSIKVRSIRRFLLIGVLQNPGFILIVVLYTIVHYVF